MVDIIREKIQRALSKGNTFEKFVHEITNTEHINLYKYESIYQSYKDYIIKNSKIIFVRGRQTVEFSSENYFNFTIMLEIMNGETYEKYNLSIDISCHQADRIFISSIFYISELIESDKAISYKKIMPNNVKYVISYYYLNKNITICKIISNNYVLIECYDEFRPIYGFEISGNTFRIWRGEPLEDIYLEAEIRQGESIVTNIITDETIDKEIFIKLLDEIINYYDFLGEHTKVFPR